MTKQTETTSAVETETKSEKFKRLATARVNLALSGIKKLGDLANKALYDYTDAEVEKVETILTEATAAAMASLREGKSKRAKTSLFD